jgi:nicotinamide phosphoribosyltransferase
MCAGSKEDEKGTYLRLLNTYPTGILSVVSDTWDLWNVLTNILPDLKETIMSRDGKLVIRPDSGDPADILCGKSGKIQDISKYFPEGEVLPEYFEDYLLEEVREDTPHGECGPDEWSNTYIIRGKIYEATIHNISWNRYDKQYYFIDMWGKAKITVEEKEYTPEDKGVIQLLWDTFGGTVNEQGYKILDSHIGAIYGDSITPERAENICARLEANGFASTNVVLGIGSFTYQFNTRDTFGFAMKATYVEKKVPTYDEKGEVDGFNIVGESIFKDPVTDSGMKKSARGLVKVVDQDGTPTLVDECTWEEYFAEDNLLKPVFLDGEFVNRVTFSEIRSRINKLVS